MPASESVKGMTAAEVSVKNMFIDDDRRRPGSRGLQAKWVIIVSCCAVPVIRQLCGGDAEIGSLLFDLIRKEAEEIRTKQDAVRRQLRALHPNQRFDFVSRNIAAAQAAS